MNNKKYALAACLALVSICLKAQVVDSAYHEAHRPQVHFSPKAHWMNDPNGMVYYNGNYNLFFQYYPNGTTWGPMHWGHATSRDMVHWQQLPIALFPDSLGYIFSGSAVVDDHNTSGFGKNDNAPLVAIFTSHDPKLEKAGSNKVQTQSIAYSLDSGLTWIKYTGNPVIKNPGIVDFRDPKVMWYALQKKWIMTLATRDRVTFFSSPDLKEWTKMGDFGNNDGAHTGVWECPDLFQLKLDEKIYWVLSVSVNPGAPNGGSGTQYFVGDFEGTTFTPVDKRTRWVDYGPDDYAGVTWSNTGNRRIYLGWMSNWMYAGQVPTEQWRGAMTIPRELQLKKVGDEILLISKPISELKNNELSPLDLSKNLLMGKPVNQLPGQFDLKMHIGNVDDYSFILSNDMGERLVIGYDKVNNDYYIDRTRSGQIAFNPGFGKIGYAPRLSTENTSDLQLIVDVSSVELFADNGLSVMTGIFFPGQPFNHLQFVNNKKIDVKDIALMPLKSIWQQR